MHLLPKRRWLRFSVRTLLVAVTIFCVWLGWQVSIVRERAAVRRLVLEHSGEIMTWAEQGTRKLQVPSMFRGWLGDTFEARIIVYDLSEVEFSRVANAFPEAEVEVYDSSEKGLTAWAKYHRRSDLFDRQRARDRSF